MLITFLRRKAVSVPASAARERGRVGLRTINLAGAGLVGVSLLLLMLFQSRTLWEAPSLVADRWRQFFWPLRDLFPKEWVFSPRGGWVEVENSALYVLLLALFFGVYVRAVMLLFRSRRLDVEHGGAALRRIVFWTAIVLLVMLILPAYVSKDMFNYIWYGRMVGVYGDNPFITSPSNYAWSDTARWIQWTYWVDTPSVYGPAWVSLAGVAGWIAQRIDGDIVTHLISQRLLIDLAHIANIVLIWKVASIVVPKYWSRPAGVSEGVPGSRWHTAAIAAVTLTYAWNPLTLYEFGWNGHNDVLLVTGLLAAILLHLKGHWRPAVLAFALASLVKVTGLVFLPGYLWLVVWQNGGVDGARRWLHGLWVAAQGVAIVLATWALCYLPYWSGPGILDALSGGVAAKWYVNSIGYVLRWKLPEGLHTLAYGLDLHPYSFWTAQAIGFRLDWPARWGMLIITAAIAIVQTWYARTFPRMVVAWGWAVLAYLTLGSVWFWPWYVSWLIVPVALVGPGRLWKATQVFAFSALVYYAVVPRNGSVFHPLDGWTGLVIALPPLAYVVFSGLLEAARSRVSSVPEPRGALQAVAVPAAADPDRET